MNNQDNFFSIIDGTMKIIGLFQGHGAEGSNVSASAMGHMLDYLRNKNDVFKSNNINNATPDQILIEIQKAFKYT